MSTEFTEVVRRDDGQYEVVAFRDGFRHVLGTFQTEEEAQSWVLQENITVDRAGSDLGIAKPGGRQGL